jgi:hypothetical protein
VSTSYLKVVPGDRQQDLADLIRKQPSENYDDQLARKSYCRKIKQLKRLGKELFAWHMAWTMILCRQKPAAEKLFQALLWHSSVKRDHHDVPRTPGIIRKGKCFTYQTLANWSEQTGLSYQQLRDAADWLVEQKLVVRMRGNQTTHWRIWIVSCARQLKELRNEWDRKQEPAQQHSKQRIYG